MIASVLGYSIGKCAKASQKHSIWLLFINSSIRQY